MSLTGYVQDTKVQAQQQIASNNLSITSLYSAISGMNDQITSFQSQIAALQSQNLALTGDMSKCDSIVVILNGQ